MSPFYSKRSSIISNTTNNALPAALPPGQTTCKSHIQEPSLRKCSRRPEVVEAYLFALYTAVMGDGAGLSSSSTAQSSACEKLCFFHEHGISLVRGSLLYSVSSGFYESLLGQLFVSFGRGWVGGRGRGVRWKSRGYAAGACVVDMLRLEETPAEQMQHTRGVCTLCRERTGHGGRAKHAAGARPKDEFV